MKNPTSEEANIKWIWGLICSGKVKQGIQAFELLKKKKAAGLIYEDEEKSIELVKLKKIISAISGIQNVNPEDDELDPNLLQIAQLC